MAQKHLEDFSKKEATDSGKETREPRVSLLTENVNNEKGKRVFPPVAPHNLPPATLYRQLTMEKLERP